LQRKAEPFELCAYLITARGPAKYSRLLLHWVDSVNARKVPPGARLLLLTVAPSNGERDRADFRGGRLP